MEKYWWKRSSTRTCNKKVPGRGNSRCRKVHVIVPQRWTRQARHARPQWRRAQAQHKARPNQKRRRARRTVEARPAPSGGAAKAKRRRARSTKRRAQATIEARPKQQRRRARAQVKARPSHERGAPKSGSRRDFVWSGAANKLVGGAGPQVLPAFPVLCGAEAPHQIAPTPHRGAPKATTERAAVSQSAPKVTNERAAATRKHAKTNHRARRSDPRPKSPPTKRSNLKPRSWPKSA
ncbi:hypothetical protein SAMN05661093_00633 [Kibdelosporangium aridum]|uniref:Uncharacterized protein n=1 Tax=Kibdelosporangium aridum TaxID=2030 RepID=A0A1W2ABC8_KIBAR|nr:hypothetical protein SAMN05661093_00633 [Kibdelosporangium aridum]